MDGLDRTPELPKARRPTHIDRRPRLTPFGQSLRVLDHSEIPGTTPGSTSIQNGHSRPLQPHKLRRRLPPERITEIGELLKTIELGEDGKENHALDQKQMPPPPSPFKPNQVVHDSPKPTMRLFAPMSKVIRIKNKDYMIIGALGTGGSCKVYSALHDGQIVAIKDVTLPEDVSMREVKDNYLREIDVLKKLNDCDHVVHLIDYEIRDAENKLFMVMEKGDSDLYTVLEQSSKDWITIRFFWRDMLKAVARIHKLGIIHQDLKPANFIVVKGRLKLIDFGISDDIGDATSVFRDCAIGTFNYMSPELIQQSNEASIKTSRASDIWSLGCILYSLAFGSPPFAHIKNVGSKIMAIVDPKHEIRYPDYRDTDLLDVLRKCLVRNPRERSSAEELLNHQFLLGPPKWHA